MIRVWCFSPAWGLPTTGPFALKLIAWLRMAGLPYELAYQDDPRKGPRGKSPWIEDGDRTLADSELIIEHLEQTRRLDPDAGASEVRRARDLAIRRLLEEHFHQILEYELIVHDDGWPHMRQLLTSLPPVVRDVVGVAMRRHFRAQLRARGIGRHAPDQITRMGIADVDAVAALLGDDDYLGGVEPRTVDASAFGMLGLMRYSPLETPVARYIRQHPRLGAYLSRLRQRWFADDDAELERDVHDTAPELSARSESAAPRSSRTPPRSPGPRRSPA